MMLGTTSSSTLLAAAGTGGGAAAAAAEAHDSGGGGSGGDGGTGTIHSGFSDEEKGGERGIGGGGGNRWPRQETLALLKIRSEMGVAFRDASLKGPLWEEVSRKMGELGYQRNAKKCKEKFENVYKYHKRTREGRASKSDGKSYRFFEQLEALENNPSLHHHHQQLPPPPQAAAAVPMPPMLAALTNPPISHVVSTTVSSPNPVSFSPASLNNPIISSLQQQLPPPAATTANAFNSNNNNIPAMGSHHPINMSDSTSSSSTSSDEDIGRRRQKRKRKFKDFFGRLMKDVIDKQEELQRFFLETLEKRERDRMIREEAWRVQEMARMNRELDLLAQERSMSSAKDSAIMQFLQNITAQQPHQIPQTTLPSIVVTTTTNVPPISVPIVAAQPISVVAAPPPTAAVVLAPPVEASRSHDNGGGGDNFAGSASSSRWPKAEVEALINLRSNLDMKYQENGPKGPLWEEISSEMSKLGYSRSSKRCKEKWENINKYFKKVKESNKKRPEDSKTCPYFHQLDALYKEKNNKGDHVPSYSSSYTTNMISKPAENNPNMVVPIMVTPEQQWPQQQDHVRMEEDHESDNMDDDDDDDEDGGGEYEIVTNKGTSNSVATTAAE